MSRNCYIAIALSGLIIVVIGVILWQPPKNQPLESEVIAQGLGVLNKAAFLYAQTHDKLPPTQSIEPLLAFSEVFRQEITANKKRFRIAAGVVSKSFDEISDDEALIEATGFSSQASITAHGEIVWSQR